MERCMDLARRIYSRDLKVAAMREIDSGRRIGEVARHLEVSPQLLERWRIYVGSQAAAERTLASIRDWIEKHLRLKVNAGKSGTGRVWERKFLGFRLNRELRVGIAPESVERFRAKVRELWRSCRSVTSNELRDGWDSFIRGWWGYYQLAEDRRSIFGLEGWIRRHMRKLFWLRWHGREGRERKLRGLGVTGPLLKAASSSRGAWRVAAALCMQKALNNAALRKTGFLMPSDLAAKPQGC